MNQTPPYLSVIIPAYNEEKRIRHTLEAIYAYLAPQPYAWEILVVLDGPTDNTLGVVQQFSQGKPQIRWMNRPENRGKGYTVREGMLAACGTVRLFTDADNSTDITHFDQMRPLLDQGYEVVIGSRDHKDVSGARQSVPQPLIKRILGNLGNLLVQVTAVPGIWDTQCGFKAFSAPTAVRIFTLSRIDRWGFDMEALALARRFGYQIGIIPIHWIDSQGTHVQSLDYVRTLLEAFKIRWNLITGAYNQPVSILTTR